MRTINTISACSPNPVVPLLGISLVDNSCVSTRLLIKGTVGNNQRFQTTPMPINRGFEK